MFPPDKKIYSVPIEEDFRKRQVRDPEYIQEYVAEELRNINTPMYTSSYTEEVQEGRPSSDPPLTESEIKFDQWRKELVNGREIGTFIQSEYAPEQEVRTGEDLSSFNVAGQADLDRFGIPLTVSGGFGRTDRGSEFTYPIGHPFEGQRVPEEIMNRFGLQDPEESSRNYELRVDSKIGNLLYGQGRTKHVDPTGEIHKDRTRSRGVEMKVSEVLNGIAPDWMTLDSVDVDVGYTESGPAPDPDRRFEASVDIPVGEGSVSLGASRDIYPDPFREDETLVGIKGAIPFQEGGIGITPLPKHPVLAGEQHMLAYITPEEADTLREQGGGVSPDGGQYVGPSGVPAFYAQGAPGVDAAAAGIGSDGGGSTNGNQHPLALKTHIAKKRAINALTKAALDRAKTREGTVENTALRSLMAQLSKEAESLGHDPDAANKARFLRAMKKRNPLWGKPLGLVDAQGQKYSMAQLRDMPAKAVQSLLSDSRTSSWGDPTSPLGIATLGLGTSIMSFANPKMMLPVFAMEKAYDFTSDEGVPSLGLYGLVEQGSKELFGEEGFWGSLSKLTNFGEDSPEVDGERIDYSVDGERIDTGNEPPEGFNPEGSTSIDDHAEAFTVNQADGKLRSRYNALDDQHDLGLEDYSAARDFVDKRLHNLTISKNMLQHPLVSPYAKDFSLNLPPGIFIEAYLSKDFNQGGYAQKLATATGVTLSAAEEYLKDSPVVSMQFPGSDPEPFVPTLPHGTSFKPTPPAPPPAKNAWESMTSGGGTPSINDQINFIRSVGAPLPSKPSGGYAETIWRNKIPAAYNQATIIAKANVAENQRLANIIQKQADDFVKKQAVVSQEQSFGPAGSSYTAEELANITGVPLSEAEEYLSSI